MVKMVRLDLHGQIQPAASLTPQHYADSPFNTKTPIAATITNTPENTATLRRNLGAISLQKRGLRGDQPLQPWDSALFSSLETSVSAGDLIPIIHITCTTQYRVLYRNFKVTWGPAYQDMETCARLERSLKKHIGWAITKYGCKTAGGPVVGGYVMEAIGQMPLGCEDLLADSIREAFMVNPRFLRFLRTQLRYIARIMLYTTPRWTGPFCVIECASRPFEPLTSYYIFYYTSASLSSLLWSNHRDQAVCIIQPEWYPLWKRLFFFPNITSI